MVSDKYLKENGFKERAVDCVCPHCVPVAEVVSTHPIGRYILMCQDTAILLIDGCYVDFNNNAEEIVIYYYEGDK